MRNLRYGAIATGSVYLTWRLTMTWQGANPVMFFLLFAAEAFGFVRLLTETSLLGDLRPATRTPEKALAPDADVVVVVTDEPASEVRAAVLSAKLIRGYRALRLVDRDDRPDVAEIAGHFDVERVVGGAGADLGALIDEALAQCGSLFTLLMPADVVVLPDILEVSAPAFDDPEVGVVVSRVENTNAVDAVDFGGYGDHLLRHELMVSKLDDAGALPWWPGMAVVRRSAIREIDGMSRGRQGVTMSTGLRLQAAGWRITDVPVVVARRLAPWTDDRQLHRSARDLHERLSVLVDKEAGTRHERSTRLQRRVYRSADLQVGRGIQRLVLIGLLGIVMFTSVVPLVANPALLVPLWGAWMSFSLLYRREATLAVGFVPWMVSDLRLLTTDLAVAFRALPGRELGSDLVDPAPGRMTRRVLLLGLQIGLAAALALIGLGIVRPEQGDFTTLAALGITAWLWVMVFRARSALRMRQSRQSFRTHEHLAVLASEGRMAVVGVSPFGIDVLSKAPMHVGQKLRIAFALPRVEGPDQRFEVSTSVRRSGPEGGHHRAYLRFSQLTDAEVDRITEYCSVVAGERLLRDAAAPVDASMVQSVARVVR